MFPCVLQTFSSSGVIYEFMNEVTYSDVFAPNMVLLLR